MQLNQILVEFITISSVVDSPMVIGTESNDIVGMVEIDPVTLEVSHGYDEEVDGRQLTVIDEHNLSTNFFEYHNENISKL